MYHHRIFIRKSLPLPPPIATITSNHTARSPHSHHKTHYPRHITSSHHRRHYHHIFKRFWSRAVQFSAGIHVQHIVFIIVLIINSSLWLIPAGNSNSTTVQEEPPPMRGTTTAHEESCLMSSYTHSKGKG